MASLLIIGFHRSGTSMLSRILHASGLFLGEKLLGAAISNPYGHYEDEEIIAFHDRVLKAEGMDWMFAGNADELRLSQDDKGWMAQFVAKRNTAHPLWGFKDPRACLFIQHWGSVLGRQPCLVVFRDFLETTQSLLTRQARDLLDGRGPTQRHLRFWQQPDLAYAMWNAHNRQVLQFVRDNPDQALCITHRQLLAEFPLIEHLNRRFDLDLAPIPLGQMVDERATTQDVGPLPPLQGAVREEAFALWREIEALTGAEPLDLETRLEQAQRERERVIAADRPLSAVASHDRQRLREYRELMPRIAKPLAKTTAPAA